VKSTKFWGVLVHSSSVRVRWGFWSH